MNHQAARKQLAEAVARSQAFPAKAARHVADCKECGPWLDRLLAAERAYEGATPISIRVMRYMEDELIPKTPAPIAAVKTPNVRAWKWTIGLVGGLAMVTAALMVWPRSEVPDELVARGRVNSAGPGVALRMLCVGTSGVVAEARLGGDPAPAHLDCTTRDILGLAISADSKATARYLYTFGELGDGHVQWYHPDPEKSPDSNMLPSAPFTNFTPEGIRLGVRHKPGHVKVHVVLSPRSMELPELEKLVASGKDPGEGVLVREVEMDLQ